MGQKSCAADGLGDLGRDEAEVSGIEGMVGGGRVEDMENSIGDRNSYNGLAMLEKIWAESITVGSYVWVNGEHGQFDIIKGESLRKENLLLAGEYALDRYIFKGEEG